MSVIEEYFLGWAFIFNVAGTPRDPAKFAKPPEYLDLYRTFRFSQINRVEPDNLFNWFFGNGLIMGFLTGFFGLFFWIFGYAFATIPVCIVAVSVGGAGTWGC